MRLLTTALLWGVVVPSVLGVPAIAHASTPATQESAGVSAVAQAALRSAPAALDALATLPADGIGAFLEKDGPALLDRLSTPSAIDQVASWWSTLQAPERSRLERKASPLVGNLDGVPFAVRAQVNETRLRARIEAVQRAASHTFGVAALGAVSDLAALRAVSEALRTPDGGPARSLITFQTSGSMLAAIAIGDVDSATDVSILVPGMLYTVQGQLVSWTSVAADLYTAQSAALQRIGATGRSVATVAWLGYHTPDILGALSLNAARQGADRLESVLSGLRAVRAEDQPFISVIAHSYGSTAALLALQRGAVSVDALALLGSPGGEVASAHSLDVNGGNVYVGAARFDPVAICGFFGSNPDDPAFGAHRMPLGGGVDPLDGEPLLPVTGHNGYFVPGSQSMLNLALIGIGRGSLAMTDARAESVR
ncbi:MAG TPA: alpha/beta hydrolase [Humibacter sp.]|nr:alpha/beta hydrolase [Humibacter sp.]